MSEMTPLQLSTEPAPARLWGLFSRFDDSEGVVYAGPPPYLPLEVLLRELESNPCVERGFIEVVRKHEVAFIEGLEGLAPSIATRLRLMNSMSNAAMLLYFRKQREKSVPFSGNSGARVLSLEVIDVAPQWEPQIFVLLGLIIPRRLRAEDVGDALEEIGCLRSRGAPRWRIWVKTMSSSFWILLAALREIRATAKGITRES